MKTIYSLILVLSFSFPVRAEMETAFLTDDETEIQMLLQHYISGARNGDSREMRQIFHKDATITGWFLLNPSEPGEHLPVSRPIRKLFEVTDTLGPVSSLQVRIIGIQVFGVIAHARIELRDWLGVDYVGSMNLIKTPVGWKVYSKAINQPIDQVIGNRIVKSKNPMTVVNPNTAFIADQGQYARMAF